MNLATEATDTYGNALENQEKYEESLAGRTQALKTELTALWVELVDSDSLKYFIDSIKQLVIGLQDTATGLKPLIDLLSILLSLASRIASIAPGGLIVSILGLKYGSKFTSINNALREFTGLTKEATVATEANAAAKTEDAAAAETDAVANEADAAAQDANTTATNTNTAAKDGNAASTTILTDATMSSTVATNGFTAAWNKLKIAFASNPVGATVIVLTALYTIISKIVRYVNQAKERAEEAYKESVKDLDDIQNKLDEIEKSIKKINEQDKLSFTDKQELKLLEDENEALREQYALKEATYRIKRQEAEQKILDDSGISYIEDLRKMLRDGNTLDSNIGYRDLLDEGAYKEWAKNLVGTNDPLINYLLYGSSDEKTIKQVTLKLSDLSDNVLSKYKSDYDRIISDLNDPEKANKVTATDFEFKQWYEDQQELYDLVYAKLFSVSSHNKKVFNKLINDENKEIQTELDELNKEIKANPSGDERGGVSAFIARRIKESYPALQKAIDDALFVNMDGEKTTNLYKFSEEYAVTFKTDVESAFKRNPIDLATWFTDSSSIDSDKTWKDITDSIDSGLNALGSALEKHRKGNEILDPLEIFNITDLQDSIFQQLGFEKFETYLNDYRNRIFSNMSAVDRDALIKSGKDVEYALTDYIKDVYKKAMRAAGDTSNIEGFDLFIDQLETWIHAAEGGSKEVDTLYDSYKDLMSIYDDVQKGETLDVKTVTRLITEYGALQDNIEITSDGYSIEKDALIDLINQYIGYSNTAIAAEINTAKTTLDKTKLKIQAMGYEIDTLRDLKEEYLSVADSIDGTDIKKELFRQYRASGMGVEEAMKEAMDVASKYFALSLLDEYDKTDEYIGTLEERLRQLDETQEGFKSGSGNKLDWIANSFENISRAAEEVKQKYDNLFSTSGSLAGVEEANKLLEEHKDRLQDLEAAAEKAAASYQEEFDKLGFSKDEEERIKNVALGRADAWTIEEFKNDSKTYERWNDGLDLYKKIVDFDKQAADFRHQQTEDDIQALQNYSDYYSATIDEYEAKISNTGDIKQQQKYVDEIYKATEKQYEYDKRIAELKEDFVTLTKLQEEEELKLNELLVRRSQIAIDAIQKRYDRVISEYDNRQSILEHGIAMTEAKGSFVSTKYYDALIDNERENINAMLAERDRLVNELNGINISKEGGLEAWWNTKDAIDQLTASIYESEESLVEWKNTIRQIGWDLFDRITDTVHGVADEAEYLASLFSNDDMFKYSKELWSNDGSQTRVYYGGWSKEGLATLAMYELQIKTNTELVDDYTDEINELNKQIKDKPTDLTLIDRRNELIEKQRESIQAIQEEKQAILDLVREGYDKQLSSLEELSSKYMEALNAEKSLFDYQKSVKKQTKDILNLRKQMAAYANDTSEEARGKLQQLTVQLQEAEEGLQDTQYERYLSDQQEILDRMYNTFETYVDNKMDEREKVLKEVSATVDSNQKLINKTIKKEVDELGGSLSATMKGILKEPIHNGLTIEQVISKKDTDIEAIANSTSSTDDILKNYINSYGKDGFKTHIKNISEKINSIDANLISLANSLGLKVDQTNSLGEKYYNRVSSSDFYQKGKYGNYAKYSTATLKDMYGTMMNKERTMLLKDDPRYGAFDEDNPSKYYKIMYQWLKRNGYASGARRIRNNELAWTQEKGLEAIIRPSDGAILTPLSRGDSVLNAGATQNIWDMANNPIKFIKDNLSFPVSVNSANGGNFDIQQSMAITLPNVKNYNEFVTELQHDKKFERMLQDMTVNQLTGGSTLAKYKHKY